MNYQIKTESEYKRVREEHTFRWEIADMKFSEFSGSNHEIPFDFSNWNRFKKEGYKLYMLDISYHELIELGLYYEI